jgi:hypothetical protein
LRQKIENNHIEHILKMFVWCLLLTKFENSQKKSDIKIIKIHVKKWLTLLYINY